MDIGVVPELNAKFFSLVCSGLLLMNL